MNDKAQFYVLESIIAVVMLLLSLVFVYTLSPAATVSPETSTQLKLLADETLFALRNTPPEKELVGQWDFENGGGSIVHDGSTYGNDGTVFGNPVWLSGLHGDYAILLDGNDDYIDCGNQQSLVLDDKITVAAWVYNKETRSGKIPVSKGSYNNDGWYWWIDSENWRMTINNQTSHSVISSEYHLSTNEWHHLVSIIDNANMRVSFYVDGKLVKTASMPFQVYPNKNRRLLIGKYRSGNYYWNGILDDIRLYNRALTTTEIHNQLLAGDWRFDKGVGDIAIDYSGFEKNSTITEAQWTQGKFEYGLEFNGNSYTLTSDTIPIPTKYTLEAWFKGNNLDQNSQNIYGFGWERKIGLRLQKSNGDPIVGILIRNAADTGFHSVHITNRNILDGKWHHLAATVDRETLRVVTYIDGKISRDTTIADHYNGSRQIIIGGWSKTYGRFNGTIDEARLWFYARTENEINTTYNQSSYSFHSQNPEYEDLLTQWIIRNDNYSRNEFAATLQKMLPSNVFYQLNITDGLNKYYWYKGEKHELARKTAKSHYIISHDTRIYDIELELWRI